MLFEKIAQLYLTGCRRVVDVTYGKGVIWKRTAQLGFVLHKLDLRTGTDFGKIPFADQTLDAFILDPPFLRSPSTAYEKLPRFRDNYQLASGQGLRNHEDILRMYDRAGREASRVLRLGGRMIVKCQDHVSNGEPRLTHVDIINRYLVHRLRFVDLFVLHQVSAPRIPPQNRKQIFARKNHSFFLVFERATRMRGPKPIQW